MSESDFLDWLYHTITNHYGSTLGSAANKVFEFKRMARKRVPPISAYIIDMYVLTHSF